MHDHRRRDRTKLPAGIQTSGPATLADVARRAEVAKSTVSRALSNDPNLNIREETRLRIQAAAAELSYIPNPNARSLRLSRTWTIAFVVPELGSPVFGQIIEGAHRAAAEQNYSVLIAQVEEGGSPRELGRRIVLGSRVDGVLLGTVDDQRLLDDFTSLGARVVAVNCDTGDANDYSVIVDNEAGAQLAVGHLAELGHARIAYLCAAAPTYVSDRRRSGFIAGLEAANLPVDPRLLREINPSAHDAEAAALDLLSDIDRPTAFVAWNLAVAAGITRAARKLKLCVPDAVSVISLNDTRAAEMMTPAVTAVRLPLFRLGWSAATNLIDLIEGRRVDPHAMILRPDGVVHRESSGQLSLP
ncbi:LacI family DNA-binding transcriptional regulator [Acuticoccus kandeliae]|uniref:LacI family DNA-binding transcriptional regulator n=1 Tax=Acuticoccus kandeliae TaxID=2073160 RepID=UPI000D3E5725|nr:LacI family DNA-binding transcriptional regulator [Acuticoccus kandeliae]